MDVVILVHISFLIIFLLEPNMIFIWSYFNSFSRINKFRKFFSKNVENQVRTRFTYLFPIILCPGHI